MLRLSRQLDYGKPAPDFALPDTEGRIRSLGEFGGSPALVVAFICNHCPFVLHVIDEVVVLALEYAVKGLQVVAISSNWPDEFPDDDYAHMQIFVRERDLPFPYLHDESQDVALAYNAICTPDFFLYGPDRTLYYAGQLDPSRPKINRPRSPACRRCVPTCRSRARICAARSMRCWPANLRLNRNCPAPGAV